MYTIILFIDSSGPLVSTVESDDCSSDNGIIVATLATLVVILIIIIIVYIILILVLLRRLKKNHKSQKVRYITM